MSVRRHEQIVINTGLRFTVYPVGIQSTMTTIAVTSPNNLQFDDSS